MSKIDELSLTMSPPLLFVNPSSGGSGEEIDYLIEYNQRLAKQHQEYATLVAEAYAELKESNNV